jgi:hypothetical protein
MASKLNAYRDTKVPAYQSIGEITGLLGRFGASAFQTLDIPEDTRAGKPGVIGISFYLTRNGVTLAYRIMRRYQYVRGRNGQGNAGTTKDQKARALFYHVKAMLDEVDGEDVTVVEVLFPALLVKDPTDGTVATVYERSAELLPQLQVGDVRRLLALM